jgi:hypothetical protein
MRAFVLLAALALAGCATSTDEGMGDLFGSHLKGAALEGALTKAAAHPLGSKENPARANMPPGQRAYLERLRCSDGNAPAFHQGGSVGEGPFGSIMDVYELKCLGGTPATASVYMDMYHDHSEDRSIPGFTIRAR